MKRVECYAVSDIKDALGGMIDYAIAKESACKNNDELKNLEYWSERKATLLDVAYALDLSPVTTMTQYGSKMIEEIKL